jgi:acyl-CoA synthetase (AMP-forming)/AMP-acid ligase II
MDLGHATTTLAQGEVVVFGKDNQLMGKVVAAGINLFREESLSDLKKRMRVYCKNRLEAYKIPAYIEIHEKQPVSARFKKVRG